MGTGRTDELIPIDIPTHRNAPKDKSSDNVKPEARIHKWIVFQTLGIPLKNARGPRELVEAIIHAMLGHFNLFKSGWLHGDVSVGNVMIMKKEVIPAVSDFACTKGIINCVGFISDGDQAVRWEEEEDKHEERCSGTLPFVSVRRISKWNYGHQVGHTPIDDLESFAWVLLWSVLNILEVRKELSGLEPMWLGIMRSDTAAKQTNRLSIARDLEFQHGMGDFSKGVAPFGPLLVKWFSESKDAEFKLMKRKAHKGKLSEFDYHEVYESFIDSGLQHMAQLADAWVDN